MTEQILWVIRFRWVAILGQAILCGVGYLSLGAALPLAPMGVIIAVAAGTNLLLSLTTASNERLAIASILVVDVGVLTGLLYFSGGSANPFSILYLVHVALAAFLLGRSWTWIMVALSTIGFTLLFYAYVPLPSIQHDHGMHHAAGEAFSLHLQGMLFAFVLAAALLGYFLSRMTHALREREREVRDLQLVALNQEKLASLTRLAAGAAHELNTPLGTIALVAAELQQKLEEMAGGKECVTDAALIGAEVARCSEIIRRMGVESGFQQGEMPSRKTLHELRDAILAWLDQTERSRVEISLVDEERTVVLPIRSYCEAVGELISNAIDASPIDHKVQVHLKIREGAIQCEVSDGGSGISDDARTRIGEPFYTTKEPGKGMGLGVFLVKLFAKSAGGTLEYMRGVSGGTIASLVIPVKIGGVV